MWMHDFQQAVLDPFESVPLTCIRAINAIKLQDI